MSNHNKRVAVVIASLWLLLGVVTLAEAQPAPAMPAARPAAMAPVMAAAPVVRPAPRRVAPMPAPRRRAAPKPAAMLAVMAPAMAAAPVAMQPAVMAPVMAVAPAAMEPAATAPAPEKTVDPKAKKDSKGSVIGGFALKLVLYLVSAFLAAFIPVFTAWLYKKAKVEDLSHKDKIDDIVLRGIDLGIGKAEEEARKLYDNPMDGAKKLAIATETANKYIVDSGLPEKGADYLATMIEARLGVARNGDKKAPPKVEDKPEEKKDEPKADDKPEKEEDKPKKGDDK